MPAPVNKDGGDGHAHIEVPEEHAVPRSDGESSPGMKNSKGWDGKLRVPKSALLSNPEALSDPEYSDDDHVMNGEEIVADEGTSTPCTPFLDAPILVLCD
jgi:protein phosphatase 1 regulatory subunit 7